MKKMIIGLLLIMSTLGYGFDENYMNTYNNDRKNHVKLMKDMQVLSEELYYQKRISYNMTSKILDVFIEINKMHDYHLGLIENNDKELMYDIIKTNNIIDEQLKQINTYLLSK